MFFFISRLPEFKSFEELEPPKHSKVKRQSSTSNAPEHEEQPDVCVAEWRNRPTNEILQKLNVRKTQYPEALTELVLEVTPGGRVVCLPGLSVRAAGDLERDALSSPRAGVRGCAFVPLI